MSVSLTTIGSSAAATGTVTSTGIGSGLDINSIVTSLVNAEINPQKTLLTTTQTNDQTTISAFGALSSALATLQTATDALTTGHALNAMKASSSNSSALSATTTNQAVSGSYQVSVTQLAQANTLVSGVYSTADSEVGTGSFAISAGGGSFNVTLGAGSDSLANLRDAINSADDNTGVSASIVYAKDGARLLLTAQQSGTANAVSVTTTAATFTTLTPAADAKLTVAGFDVTSASNIVSNAIDGVTLNLTQMTTSPVTVSVAADSSAATTAVQSFVTAYNAVQSLLSTDTAYTPASSTSTTGSAGPLQGDSATMSLMRRLSTLIGVTGGSGGINSLADLGITSDPTSTTGALTVDATKLASVLQQNSAGAKNLFSGATGLGTQLNSVLDGYIGPGGLIGTKTSLLQDQLTTISGKLDSLTTRSTQLTAQYSAQFNAMDAIVAGYKNTSSLLTQLYAPRTTDASGNSN